MDSYRQDLIATAFRKAVSIRQKIKELSITPQLKEDELEELAKKLAAEKALKTGVKISETIAGQEWYVKSLLKYSSMSKEELLEAQYRELLIDNSSFDELLEMMP